MPEKALNIIEHFCKRYIVFRNNMPFFAAFMADADQESRRNNLKKMYFKLKKTHFLLCRMLVYYNYSNTEGHPD